MNDSDSPPPSPPAAPRWLGRGAVGRTARRRALRVALLGTFAFAAAPPRARGEGPPAPTTAPDAAARAEASFQAGLKLAQAREHAKAVAQYAAALAVDAGSAKAHAYKAVSHLALGQVPAAQAEADAAMKLDARESRYCEIAGQARVAAGQVDAGRALYERAASLSPRTAGATWTDLAAALAARDDDRLGGAIEAALKSAAAADPPAPEALFQLGQGYATAGKQEGKAYLQRYVDLESKLPAEQRDGQKVRVARQLIRALDMLKQAR